MLRTLLTCALLMLWIGGAWADVHDLTGGVMIVHAVPELSYTEPRPKGGYCDFCDLTRCEDQVNQVSERPSIWFVISAWTEEKIFAGAEFGIGEYPSDLYVFLDDGPCWPMGMAIYHPDVRQWPGPNTGVALATMKVDWKGQMVPIYWFAGYQYKGTGTVPLIESPRTNFSGWINGVERTKTFPAACLGALGVGVPGVSCCPQAPDTTGGGTPPGTEGSPETEGAPQAE